MFKGYVGFGDTELINVARLMKYVTEGGAPSDLKVDPMVGDYADLATALGDDDYRTALLDQPPWYDATNPDSAFFAGLLPLEITGLDSSTRGRAVVEGLEDGGNPTRSRASSKTIGVTVLALANGDAALDAGINWLSGVLHPPCSEASDSCRGVPLSLFSAAPVYCDNTPNLDADPIVVQLVPTGVAAWPAPTLAYYDLSNAYLESICGPVTVTAVVHRPAGDDWEPEGRVVRMDLVDSTGEVFASVTDDLPADTSTITLTLHHDPSPGFPFGWQPVLSWYIEPGVLDGGDSDTVGSDVYDGGDSDTVGTDLVEGGEEGAPIWGGFLAVDSWTVARFPVITLEECLSELRRSFRNVVTTSGPTVLEELVQDNGEPYAARIEWTWVATDPVAYGDTTSLLRGMSVGVQGYETPTTTVALASPVNRNLNVPAPPRPPAGYFIDGVNMATMPIGTRVLLPNQTNPAQNGIYLWQGFSTPLVRAADLDTWAEATAGPIVQVLGGTTQAGTLWECTATGPGTIDVTAMPWAPATLGYSGYDDTVVFQADGIQLGDNTEVLGDDTVCPAPEPVLALCGDDPDLPALVAPPAAPTLPDPAMVAVDGYVRREFQVPPELSPQPGGMLTFTFASQADVAYRGIRVRIWADPDPDFGVADECAWETEFWITYLAPGQVVTIDGPDHVVTTTCVSGIDADHERNMRGAYGGPFVFPQLRCGERYHIAIDVPDADSAGVDTDDPRGVLVDVSVTRRGV